MSKQRKAFTLVELLVVIAIIGILFVVLISKVDFATEKSKATGVQTDFRSYQVAIETVARENAGLSVLVDNDAEGEAKYAELEKALNKNLDPKLRVEIDADGKISTEAEDPWKEQYEGQYLAPDADGTVKDRGAIVIYSKGSNLKLGTTAMTENGIVNVAVESGKETEGSDDYSISTIYTYVNGYGEIQTATNGFDGQINPSETPNVEAQSKVGGTWKFNEVLNVGPETVFKQKVDFFFTITYGGMDVLVNCEKIENMGGIDQEGHVDWTLSYYIDTTDPDMGQNDTVSSAYSYDYGWNEDFGESIKTITFVSEQVVSLQFYNWLIANATNVSSTN